MMDAAQWQQHHQQIGGYSRPMEEMIQIPNNNNHNPNNNPTNMSNNNNNNSRGGTPIVGDQRRARPQKDQNLNCPRCNSTNTKFCYYNNYSLTQPRYFCKTCRRYWTQGGSLRNVPVGGGSRKNKRSSSSSSISSSIITSSIITTTTTPLQNLIPTNNNKLIPDLNPPNSLSHLINPPQNPKLFLEGHDLNLAFPIQGMFHPPSNNDDNNNHNSNNNNNENSTCSTTATTNNNNNCSSSHQVSALELLRTGMASRGPTLNPYVPMPMPDSNTLYPSGLPNLQEFKTNHNNMNDMNNMVGSGDGNNNNNVASGGAARLLFPFADMNKLANSTPTTTPHHHHHDMDDQSKAGNDHHHHHLHHQNPTTGYWSGMLGGGTW